MAFNVFGGNPVQSAYPSYLALDLRLHSVTFIWADAYVDGPYLNEQNGIYYAVLAASVDVTTGLVNVNDITLPDARDASPGSVLRITNVGSSAFNLKKANGAVLMTAETGVSYFVQLTNNTTLAGEWTVVTFGAGTSEADANLLAGNGLYASGSKLNTNLPVILTNVVPEIDTSYRAKLIVWTGGASDITLPNIGDVPSGFYLSFNNEGSAQIDIFPGEEETKIDNKSSLSIGVNQSLILTSDGDNWWSLGFGQNQFNVTSVLNLDVSSSVDITLSNIQASNLIHKYSGEITDDFTIFFPTAANYWFVDNLTTGDFSLSVQLAGEEGDIYVLPQGTRSILYSDGDSIHVIPNTLILSDPLPIESGGTGSATQEDAAYAIFPGPPEKGDLAWYDGAIWNRLAVGNEGDSLKVGPDDTLLWSA